MSVAVLLLWAYNSCSFIRSCRHHHYYIFYYRQPTLFSEYNIWYEALPITIIVGERCNDLISILLMGDLLS